MKRLRRIILDLATVGSIAILLGFTILWVRSYSGWDWISRSSLRPWKSPYMVRHSAYAISSNGVVVLGTNNTTGPVSAHEGWSWQRVHPTETGDARPGTLWNRLGFGWQRDTRPDPSVERVREVAATGAALIFGRWSLAMPWWSVVMMTAFLPIYRLLSFRRRARRGRSVPSA
jgi:hypothetical protein